ncbi:MAG: hypothetical protein AAGF12_31885 [Myxococcota bacterium]
MTKPDELPRIPYFGYLFLGGGALTVLLGFAMPMRSRAFEGTMSGYGIITLQGDVFRSADVFVMGAFVASLLCLGLALSSRLRGFTVSFTVIGAICLILGVPVRQWGEDMSLGSWLILAGFSVAGVAAVWLGRSSRQTVRLGGRSPVPLRIGAYVVALGLLMTELAYWLLRNIDLNLGLLATLGLTALSALTMAGLVLFAVGTTSRRWLVGLAVATTATSTATNYIELAPNLEYLVLVAALVVLTVTAVAQLRRGRLLLQLCLLTGFFLVVVLGAVLFLGEGWDIGVAGLSGVAAVAFVAAAHAPRGESIRPEPTEFDAAALCKRVAAEHR